MKQVTKIGILTLLLAFVILLSTGCSVLSQLGIPNPFDSNSPTAPNNSTEHIDRLPGVPKELQENVFLNTRCGGSCETLTGKVHITILFVSDPGAVWSEEEIALQQQKINIIADTIRTDAASFGADLTLTVSYHKASTVELDITNFNPWYNNALASLDLPDTSQVNRYLEEAKGVDSAPVIFFTKRTGRSTATSQVTAGTGREYATIYQDSDPLYHELCHIYGAKDFYYPEKVQDLADTLLGDTIMKDSACGIVDSLTAYLIGWHSAPDEKATAFLVATNDITAKDMDQAHDLETYTGQVENFRIGDTVYTGNLVNGWLNGQGKMERDGAVWEGTWDNGQLHGKGTFIGVTGNRYEGDFVHGIMHGEGKYTYDDGSSYSGTWVNGQRHGFGTYNWPNGNSYTGDWVDGVRTGNGTFRWSDGASYTGSWENGLRSGHGKITYADGTTYDGTWKNDRRHGTGTMVWNNGDKYTGDWVEDARTGYGTYTWASGSRHEGQWLNGQRHGYGKYTSPNGQTQSGTWENNEYIG